MSVILVLADARARGINLPADDGVAQDILDEQEAWLAQRIGPLTGSRTERFYVGLSFTREGLGLRRYTDAVTLTDGGSAVDAAYFRLVANGSAVVRTHDAPTQWWTGPYVDATYTPNDEAAVRGVLYGLVGLAVDPETPYDSETVGDYSYSRGSAGKSPAARKAVLAASLEPKRDPALTLLTRRRLVADDPVINRPEPVW